MAKKNIYNEAELKEKAKAVFSGFPLVNKVYATSDGNVFVKENRAKLHAGEGKVLTIQREDESEQNPTKLKAEDLINQINTVTTLEELEPFKSDERKTVKDAVLAKIKELTPDEV